MPRPRASLFSLTVFLSQLVGLRLASHVVSHGPGHPSDHSDNILEDEEDFPVRHLVGAIFDEDDVTLALHHKNGQSIMAILEDEGDCIYSGYMVGCPTSTALVTGCKGEMQGVQIQSKVLGDMIFDLQDGVVMPLKKRYKRALDPDIDYDYDDSSDFGVLEEFADLDNAEAADFPQPPPKLVLNLNVYMDKEWSAEFGRTGVSKAKKILTQAKLLWAHDSLSTKVDFLFEDDKFHESPKHLLINKGNLRRELPSLLVGPDKTPSGEKMAHLYLTVKKPNEPTYTHGLAVDNGMCSSREKPRVMVLYHNSELVTAMTVAHEIGHIVGMEHDFLLGRRNHKCVSGGKDGETVMAYGDARQKFSTCSNEDFKLYYSRVVLEKVKFCLQAQSTDCSCNGISDPFLGGGKCTPGTKGLWCFVNQNTGCKTDKLYGKFVSTEPCKPKPCACSGETDITGGGLCGAWCYVAEEASCDDVQPYYGKFFSRAACGTRRTTRLPPTRRTRQTTTTATTTTTLTTTTTTTKSSGANTDGRLLLLSSDGEAGDLQVNRMGLYSLMEGVTHNNMPVWIRDLKDGKLFYSSDGYWIFGDPKSDVGGVATVGRGLASPLLGAESGWKYWAGGDWQTDDELLSVKATTLPIYPEEVIVSSHGPAKEQQLHVMGVYTMTGARQHMRPVWQNVQEKDMFLYYNGYARWMIGSDPSKAYGRIQSGRGGLHHLPEGGWKYYDVTAWATDDPTLTIA